ncbi:hypothetical protein [Candidatus Coxiella mudrowiae]|nr:hypothetical protein [Candidatus Coxiella mudrowiae]
MDKFIQALQEKFPHVFLHWEHFSSALTLIAI